MSVPNSVSGSVRKIIAALGLLAAGCMLPAASAGAAVPISLLREDVPSLAPMLERVMPAVVNVSTASLVNIDENPLLRDPFFRYFFGFPEGRSGPRKRRTQSLGSGVIIDAAKGIVVTNAHVIDKADEIDVALQDGRNFQAKLIGTDPDADIAVIKIPAAGLAEIPLGDSDRLRVGDFAVAIGSPFGLNQTVTSGIISALGRSGLGIEGYEDFIQTDASINPGNSGGALVNLHGELIGINTAILAPGGGNVGIGFAIPINMVRQLADQLIAHGSVQRGSLGVYAQDLTQELADAFNIDRRQGALVTQVVPGSAAERAGLRRGDVIVAINGKRVDDDADLRNAVGLSRVGQTLEIRVVRAGKERSIKARIDAPAEVKLSGESIHRGLAGATFTELPAEFNRLRPGVFVEGVKRNSRAWSGGLRPQDVIVYVNRRLVESLEDLARIAAGSPTLLINFWRDGRAYYLTIEP